MFRSVFQVSGVVAYWRVCQIRRSNNELAAMELMMMMMMMSTRPPTRSTAASHPRVLTLRDWVFV
jgi:hypothetical protein